MSKFIGIIVGAIEIGGGIITGNVALIISGALMLASSTAQLLLTPSANKPTRQASATTLQLGEVPRSAVFGETGIAGSLVDAFNYGGTYGTDWEVLIIALADHYCEGLPWFYVNDKQETFTGDGAVAGYSGQLEVYFRHGDLLQTLPSIVTTNGPGWASTDYGAGVCYVVVAYKADAPDAKNPVWPGGRPRFLWGVKGKRCYIARKDSTAGGSGSHRWNDPTTWEWTDNLIDCRYNWARGVYAGDQVTQPQMLLVGRGLTAAEQPPANTFAPANLCDELVAGQKRFRVDGSVNAGQKFIDVEEEFAAACGGVIVTREGAVEIEPAQAKAPAFFFTDADLITGTAIAWNEGMLSEADDGWVNTVIPRYVEPTQRWQDHAAPVRRDTADIIADGGPREQTLTLDLVKRADQAGAIGEVARRLGRLWGRGSVTLGPRFAEIEEGDWGQWTSDLHFGGATKTFRVDGFKIEKEWQNQLTLREISSGAFASVTSLADGAGALTPNPTPSLTAPPSSDFALSAVSITGSGEALPALQLLGAVTLSAVDAIVFEYRLFASGLGVDDNWVSAGIESRQTTKKTITQVAGLTSYQVSIRYRTSGELSPRRILGPVTAGAFGTASAPGDANRVRNSLFEQEGQGWAILLNSASLPVSVSAALDPATGKRYVATTGTFTAAGQTVSLGLDYTSPANRFPVTPGERLYAGSILGIGVPAGGSWVAAIGFFNAAGGVVAIPTIQSAAGGLLFPSAEYEFVTVPSGAVTGWVEFYANSGTGTGPFSIAIAEPMACGAGSSQVQRPPFTPGPSGEPGASVDANIAGDGTITIFADSAGVPQSGSFSSPTNYKLVRLGSALTSGVTASAALISGNLTFTTSLSGGIFSFQPTGPTDATLAIENRVRLTMTYQGVPRTLDIKVIRMDDPPTSSGGGGGSAGTTVNTTDLGNTTGTSYDPANAVSAELTVRTGPSGRIDITAPQAFRRITSAVGSEGALIKGQWRAIGGTYADFPGGEVAASRAASIDGEHMEDYGSLSLTDAKTGLTAATDYNVRFLWREASGGWRLARVSGTMTAAGS